jgi:ABC-type branched-subunit amino acid transport system permease subunit
MAFAIGAGYAGVAGELIGPLMGYIDPTMFSLAFSFQFLLMVVVGGAGRFEGAILGAIIVAILPEALRFAEKYYPVIFALSAILIMVFMPKGCVSFVDWTYKKLTGKEEIQLTK